MVVQPRKATMKEEGTKICLAHMKARMVHSVNLLDNLRTGYARIFIDVELTVHRDRPRELLRNGVICSHMRYAFESPQN